MRKFADRLKRRFSDVFYKSARDEGKIMKILCWMYVVVCVFLSGCSNQQVAESPPQTPASGPTPAPVTAPPPVTIQPSPEDIRAQELLIDVPKIEAYTKFYESIMGDFNNLKSADEIKTPNDLTRNRAIIEGMQSRYFANMEVPTIFAAADSLLASGLSKMKVGHVQMEMGLSMNDEGVYNKGVSEVADGAHLLADSAREVAKQARLRADEMDVIDAKRSGK